MPAPAPLTAGLLAPAWDRLERSFEAVASNDLALSALVLTVAGSVLFWLRGRLGKILQAITRSLTVTIEVDSDNEMFAWTLRWLDDRIDQHKSRRKTAIIDRRERRPGEAAVAGEAEARLRFVPAPGLHLLWLGGVAVLLDRERDDGQAKEGSPLRRETLRFRTARWWRSELEAGLREASTPSRAEKPLLVSDTYGGFDHVPHPAVKRFDHLTLPEGVEDAVRQHLGAFLGGAEEHARIGRPWRTGILLHGPPGNGKTSLIQAMAHEFGLGIAVLTNRTVTELKGGAMAEIFTQLPPGYVLVLEDVDTLGASREEGAEAADRVTLGTLLNGLDGIYTPDGLVTVLTTNHPQRLDPALIRPGRVDLRVELPPPTPAMAAAMAGRWFPASGSVLVEGVREALQNRPATAPRSVADWQARLAAAGSAETLLEGLQ